MIYQIISAIQNIWAKYKVLVIINGVVILGFLFFVLPLILPKKPLDVKQPNLQGVEKTVSGIALELNLKEPTVPQKIQLYRMGETFKQDEQIFSEIAARLKINKIIAPDLRVNDETGESLSLDLSQHRLFYSKSPLDENGEPLVKLDTTPLNVEETKKQTEEWLRSIGFDDIEANALGTQYYLSMDAYEGMEQTEPSKANVIRFTFARKLDGLEVIPGASTAEQAFVTTSHYGVIQADVPAFVATFTKDQERELLPYKSVIENIKAGRYTFTGALAAVSDNESDTQPVKFTLTSTNLVYRVDITQRAALPYWNFVGNATLRNGQVVPLEITSPAITL